MNLKKHPRGAAIAVAALAAGVAGAAVAIPAAASPHIASHTIKFTSVQLKSASFSPHTAGELDQDLNSKGALIGFDITYFAFNPKTNSGTGWATVEFKGGVIDGSLNFSASGAVTGKVTSGTGTYKGATGTISGKNLNAAGTRTAVTITYHT